MAYFNLALKRLFDIFSSLIGLIVLVPLLLFISIIVKTDSKGPVFYKQKRLTKDGRVFGFLLSSCIALLTIPTLMRGNNGEGTMRLSYD